jgi:hypothetical protein
MDPGRISPETQKLLERADRAIQESAYLRALNAEIRDQPLPSRWAKDPHREKE